MATVFSVNDESDDNNVPMEKNKCYKYDGLSTGIPNEWIGCMKCFRFFHRRCTDIDFDEMSEAEVTVKVFDFANDLFSRYSRGRYYRENKSPRKYNTSIVANWTS